MLNKWVSIKLYVKLQDTTGIISADIKVTEEAENSKTFKQKQQTDNTIPNIFVNCGLNLLQNPARSQLNNRLFTHKYLWVQ